MAYTKILSAGDIVDTAVRLIESSGSEGLSLRAAASSLGVKAPSLYRYFSDKDALELAVTESVLKDLFARLQEAAKGDDVEKRFRALADAYLRFAQERFPIYMFIMDRIPQTQGSAVAKDVWNVLLDVASGVSERADDTAAAVATWSFLHGYASLQHVGGFGASGPKGGLELGLTAFLRSFRRDASPVGKKRE